MDLSKEHLLNAYRQMKTIRGFEERAQAEIHPLKGHGEALALTARQPRICCSLLFKCTRARSCRIRVFACSLELTASGIEATSEG